MVLFLRGIWFRVSRPTFRFRVCLLRLLVCLGLRPVTSVRSFWRAGTLSGFSSRGPFFLFFMESSDSTPVPSSRRRRRDSCPSDSSPAPAAKLCGLAHSDSSTLPPGSSSADLLGCDGLNAALEPTPSCVYSALSAAPPVDGTSPRSSVTGGGLGSVFSPRFSPRFRPDLSGEDNRGVLQRLPVLDSAPPAMRQSPVLQSPVSASSVSVTSSSVRRNRLSSRQSGDADADEERPVITLVARYPDGMSRLPVTTVLRSIRPELSAGVSLVDFAETKEGYRVRTRFPGEVCSALSNMIPGLVVDKESPKLPYCDVTVRGVPVSCGEDDLHFELKQFLGPLFHSLRRLHAFTDGVPDNSRKLPVIVVRVREDGVVRLRKWRVYDALKVAFSSARTVIPPVQCYRCWRWGHRSAACPFQARCFFCGASHDASKCPARRPSRFCFACDIVGHSVCWAGCPKRKEEDARVMLALRPGDVTSGSGSAASGLRKPVPSTTDTLRSSAATSQVMAGVSFSKRLSGKGSRLVGLSRRDRRTAVPDSFGMDVDLDDGDPDSAVVPGGPGPRAAPSSADAPTTTKKAEKSSGLDPTPRDALDAAEMTRKKRELAHALRESKDRLSDTERQLAAVEAERSKCPNTKLKQAAGRHRAKLASLRIKIRALEAERAVFAATSASLAPVPSDCSSPATTSEGGSVPSWLSSVWALVKPLLASIWRSVRDSVSRLPFGGFITPILDACLGAAPVSQ